MNDKKYSVSDLLLFNESPFAYWCKTVNNLVEKGKIDESYRIPATESNLYSEHFLNKAEAHEVKLKDYYLIQQEKNVVDFSSNSTYAKTLKSIKDKSQVIYQGSLEGKEFTARPDFLILNNDKRYDVVDAKFSKSSKEKYELQLYCYGYLINEIEGYFPDSSYIYLLGNEFVEVQIQDYEEIFSKLKQNFFEFISSFDLNNPPHPFKNEYANNEFADQIKKTWFDKKSLELIGGITYKQVKELNNSGIHTLKELSSCEDNPTSISSTSFSKLLKKANALIKSDEAIFFEVNLDNTKDLTDIKEPENGDIYIDFEWYPYSGELENFFYLFGYFQINDNQSNFDYLWSDEEDEEESSLKKFVDYIIEQKQNYPEAKIYHYNHSEKTELLKLCHKYEYKENEVKEITDNSFVDLLKPIRNCFTMGLTSNSLKEVEKILEIDRLEEVQSGGESMKYFENFYFEDNWDVKKDIVEYNKQDCENLHTLHQWLISQKQLLQN